MNPVLIDTSVWVGHFRHRDLALIDLLESDRVLTHPMVWGEHLDLVNLMITKGATRCDHCHKSMAKHLKKMKNYHHNK